MALLRKAHYLRLILSVFILMSVLFIDMTSAMMIVLLILSSLLSLLNLILDTIQKFKNGEFFNSGIFIIISTIVLFIFNYEYEAAIFSLTISICNILIEKVQLNVIRKNIEEIENGKIREIIQKIISDEKSLDFYSGEVLKESIKKPLMLLIIITCILTILLPIIGHYNFQISTYRCNLAFFLSCPTIILVSLKVLGSRAIIEAAKLGIIFRNSNAVEIKDKNSVIYDNSEFFKNSVDTSNICYYTNINIDTFKNIIAHVISQSEYELFKPIKEDLNYKIDKSLISDFNDYDNGIICTVNNMPIYFGNSDFIKNLELNVDSGINKNSFYLFMSDRLIGEVNVPETNVSETAVTELDELSAGIGEMVEKNAFISVGTKAVLVFLGLIGFIKIWIAILIEALVGIYTIYNTKKL